MLSSQLSRAPIGAINLTFALAFIVLFVANFIAEKPSL